MGTSDGELSAAVLAARVADLESRIADIERSREELSIELSTRRLVVGEAGASSATASRIVAEIREGRAELRIEQPGSRSPRSSDLVLFADRGHDGLGAGLGLQLWGDGDARFELNLWRDEDGWALDAPPGRLTVID